MSARAARPSSMAEALFRREIAPWALLGVTLGLVEGATAAVLVKQHFTAAADPLVVNLAVAFVSGAPALSNVVSFVWANVAHGRERVTLMASLQALFAVLVGLVSLAPREAGGLALTVLSVVGARMVWAGVLTVRAAIWTSNYPRNVLARITGRIVIVSSLAVAAASGAIGWALETRAVDPRLIYGVGMAAGLLGAWFYRRMRVRREFRLLHEESAVGTSEPFSLRMLAQILRSDRSFREYMFWMGLYGGGNLALTAQLVLVFTDHLHLSSWTQIALLSVVPLATVPIFYRSRQGWALVGASSVTCLAALAGWIPLLWVGALLLGAAFAGANLGWHLGHNDFASLGRSQHYMGVHVTLTGVRGAIAPALGVLLYQWLESLQRGWGRYTLLLALAMTATGAFGFTLMRRTLHR
jgi:hypothetical protein